MVSWLAPVARNENCVSGVRRRFDFGSPYASFDSASYRLASNGVVDTNGPTRLHYDFAPGQGGAYHDVMDIFSSARLRYTADDASANSGRLMTATQFLTPATAFADGVVPTVAQIMANATRVLRGLGTGPGGVGTRTDAGDLLLSFFSVGSAWLPNRKWWVAVVPTSHVVGSTPSVSNDPVLAGSNPSIVGRAISVWTGRTPAAPVIASPPEQSAVLAGTMVPFSFVSKDPDRLVSFAGDLGPNDFEDLAGVQVQYAPQPTTEVPNPPWRPLVIADSAGNIPAASSIEAEGWYIDGTVHMPTTAGARQLWRDRKMLIGSGLIAGPVPPNSAVLPSGKWQIRMRTFDYGHPLADSTKSNPLGGFPPLLDASGSYQANTYPSDNTSPWSTPIFLTISSQLPAPVPISPRDDRAILALDGSGPVVVDNCDSSVGWTAQMDGVEVGATTFWEAGSVSFLTFDNPDQDADVITLQRTGPVDFTGTPYMTVEALMFSADKNFVMRADGVPLPLVSKNGDFFVFRLPGGVVNNLTFEHIRPYAEAGGFLKIRQITRDSGPPIELSWLYRNTYVTPLYQAKRTVQIRKSGDVAWTTLTADEVSNAPAYTVTTFPLVSGNRYEWRVKVRDSSGVESEYSEIARFWYVPAPASGGVLPDPSATVDGATLGCGTHRVEIYRRGGRVRVGEITGISKLKYGRVRDDISTAKIDISGWGLDCGNLLAQLQSWAYEVVIFRDNGFSVDRVWEGPITLLTYEQETVTIHAKDVMAYAYRRIVKQALSDFGNSPTAGATVVNRAERVLQNALADDDPNMLAHLQVINNTNDAKQYRTLPAYSRTAFEEVDDMAANAGLDYTTVGRAVILWGTKNRIGTLPEFRDSDLGAAPIVSEYGMSMANRYAISDGNGVYGEATRLNEDGNDPTYGPVEMLSSTWASEDDGDTPTYTAAGLETIRASFAQSAERSIADRYPPPVIVRVPDNSRLNPGTLISIQQLVPGVVIPLRSVSTLRGVADNQKLDSVVVTEENGQESINITMSPFSRDDIVAEGTAE